MGMKLYFVRNSGGRYFNGRSSNSPSWTNDISNGTAFNSIGPAKAQVTWFMKRFSNLQPPVIVECNVVEVKVIEYAEESTSNQKKKLLAKIKQANEAYDVVEGLKYSGSPTQIRHYTIEKDYLSSVLYDIRVNFKEFDAQKLGLKCSLAYC